MTAPSGSNIAGDSSHVGAQAQYVHNLYVHNESPYKLPSDASPEKKFQSGVDYLEGGMLTKARERIGEAVIGGGYETSESCFYLLLALLSGRNVQQLPKEDFDQFVAIRERVATHPEDKWTAGVRFIDRLLNSYQLSDSDLQLLTKEFNELGVTQHALISRHLEDFLKGPMLDVEWNRAAKQAAAEQKNKDREKRVWRFFQPVPAKARVRWPQPIETTAGDHLKLVVAAAVCFLSSYFIAFSALRNNGLLAILALFFAIGGGYACVRSGPQWRFAVQQLRTKDSEYLPSIRQTSTAPAGGFARNIDTLFSRYSARYVPDGVERKAWLAETSGIRKSLRDEVVEVYRESSIDAQQLAWLIRFLISDVKRRWMAGQLWKYREQLIVPLQVRAMFIVGSAVFVIGSFSTVGAAVTIKPFGVMTATLLAAASGWVAVSSWLTIAVENQRFAAEQAEAQLKLKEREAAFRRWKRRLESKPSDSEMAHWLTCDRYVMMDAAMRHYKIARSNLIAYAILAVPQKYKNGHVSKMDHGAIRNISS